MANTASSSANVCDGENLAILLALYWVIYLILNAVVFAAIMYALRKCFDNLKFPGKKSKEKDDQTPSRTDSRLSLVSRGKH